MKRGKRRRRMSNWQEDVRLTINTRKDTKKSFTSQVSNRETILRSKRFKQRKEEK